MSRPREHDDRVSTVIRLPHPLHRKLKEAAEDRDLSMNYLATKAIEDFMDRLIPADELRLTREPPREDR